MDRYMDGQTSAYMDRQMVGQMDGCTDRQTYSFEEMRRRIYKTQSAPILSSFFHNFFKNISGKGYWSRIIAN